MSTPPTVLTRKEYLALSTDELKKIVADPEKLAQVNAILSAELDTPSTEQAPVPDAPVVDDAAVAAQAAADAAKAEADRLAAEAADATKIEADKVARQEAYKAAGLTVETDASGNITKIIKTYQAKDDAGNPIGRPTYLEAKDWAELSVKQQNAHEHAVRFGERVKKQQFTKKKDDPAPVQVLSESELLKLQQDLKSEDRDLAAKAAEKVRVNDERKKLVDADKAIEDARQAKESYAFLTKHISDYNNCQANNKILSDYIRENELEWTEGNLEAALIAVESQLAPKQEKEKPAPPAPANPVPVTPAPVVQPPPAVAPPVPPVVPNNPAPPAPRPGVNGGLVPGDQSAQRPTNQPKGLTKQDIKNMSPEEYKRRHKDPKFQAEVNALQIRNGL